MTDRFQDVKELEDFPTWEELRSKGTFTDLFHLMGVLYTKNLEAARQHENRDLS